MQHKGLRIIGLVVAGPLVFGAAGLRGAVPQRPNIVIFISDDHGWLDSSVAGSPEFRTPNMERLAHDGMRLTHAFAASPSCAPSRAALLTGLMPNRNGAMLNHQPPRRDVKKWPAYLQELGYEVDAVGKMAHYKQGKNYGFDHVSHDTFHDDDSIAAAVKFLEDRKSTKPLCLLVGTNFPHVPWPEATGDQSADAFKPPASHVDTPETCAWRARYAAAVERCDADLGAVYDAARKKFGNDFVFMYFADHGAQWPFGKWNLYDAGIRVPFFVVWPGAVAPRGQSNALVSLTDVLPTVMEIAGGQPPSDLDGRSFANVLAGKASTHREEIFATQSRDGDMNVYPSRAVRTGRWKYIRNLRPEAEHHTHIDRAKPVDGTAYWDSWVERAKTDKAAAAVVDRYHHRPAEELYDVETDPLEQQNLAGDPKYGKVQTELCCLLDNWMREQGDNGVSTEDAIARAFYKPKKDGK